MSQKNFADAMNQIVNSTPNGLKAQINEKAGKNSPAFTGTPTAPTPDNDTDSTQIATTEFCQNLIRRLVGAAPETLNTLVELATAINNDPNFAQTIVQALDGKLNKTDAANTYATKSELSNVSVDTSNLAKLNQSNTFTGNMYFGTSGRIERSDDGLVVGNKITSNGGYYMIAGETFMALGNSSSSGSNKCFINLNWTNSGKVEITAPNGLYVNGTKIS